MDFFVTGPFARAASWFSADHIGSVHAKQVGSITTLCGLSTGSWTTLWEQPFVPARLQGACPTCRREVSAELALADAFASNPLTAWDESRDP